ncbi:hypothetical protein CEY12_09610 [Chryseobacterium sp. T16E-39]|uniref:hypothetical protein n=1 Tax=Chryseobacterium sp. T16E-39 TaxID=2015076 RepID=UPI000B5B3E1C|nr:hypothetical protein [Chryseobacterium sp. T16E-39]ASK30353.1 hypothetical protein CEY12_09610 [Chryseobacterium sp. T16E-39]
MKKKLLTTVMLISLAIVSKAQQKGVGINTTKPEATLDIVANTTDRSMPDAVLIPRMTATELANKDAAYTAAQNGALVFVISGRGNSGGKTEKVTGTGFYYYDEPTSKWVALASGGTVAPTAFRLNLAQPASTAYDWSNSDFDFWEFTSGSQLTLPTPSSYSGRTIYIRNQVGGTLQFSGTDGVGTPKGIASITGSAAIQIHSNGTTWYLVAGRN